MKFRILPCILLCVAGVAVTLSPACRKESTADPPEPERTGARAAYHHTREIVSYGPRPTQSAALNKTRDYLTAELEKHGWVTQRQTFEKQVPFFGKAIRFTNLTARFGEIPDREVRGILSAHIDSKYYPNRNFVGADDAASAAGVILELARQFKSRPELASQLELVFFDGEEAFELNMRPDGSNALYGSKEYALRWRMADHKPEFGIVLDMIGHKRLKIRYPSDSPAHLEAALLAAAEAEGESARYTRADTPILDDHVPLNNAGIPTIDVIGAFNPGIPGTWWHTEADNLNLISRESLGITLKVVGRMLENLLSTTKDPS